MRHGPVCLAPPSPAYVGAQVMTLPCSMTGEQSWEKHGLQLVHRLSNLCLDARDPQEVTVQDCHPQLATQEFVFTRWLLRGRANTYDFLD